MQSQKMLGLQWEWAHKMLRGEHRGTKKLKQKRQRNVDEKDQDRYTWDRSEVQLRWRVLAEIQSRGKPVRSAEIAQDCR